MALPTLKSRTILGIILLIILFGLGYFFTTPQWHKYQAAKAQLKMTEDQNAQLTQTLSHVQAFLDSFRSHQQEAAIAGLALPVEDPDYANFVSSIGDLSAASGIAIENLSVNSNLGTGEELATNSIQVQRISFRSEERRVGKECRSRWS